MACVLRRLLSRNAAPPSAIVVARADVVAERHRTQQLAPGDAGRLPHRQRGRHDRRARVRLRRSVRVVGLVGVREHAVDERGLHRAGQQRRADDGRDRTSRFGAGKCQCGAARRELGSGHHRGHGVEQVVHRLLEHLGGQRAIAGRSHVGAERGHHRAGPVCDETQRPQRHRAGRERGAAQQSRGVTGDVQAGASWVHRPSPRHHRRGGAGGPMAVPLRCDPSSGPVLQMAVVEVLVVVGARVLHQHPVLWCQRRWSSSPSTASCRTSGRRSSPRTPTGWR